MTPKELRAAILDTIMRTFVQAKITATAELEAALSHAAGNVAAWVYLEYVVPLEDMKKGEKNNG